MNFKVTLLFMLLLLDGVFLAQAKNEEPPRGIKALKITGESIKDELNLSDEQSKKLQPLLEQVNKLYGSFKKELFKQRKKNSTLGGDGGPEAMKKKMEQLQKKIVKIIDPAKSFLNEEQYKKLTDKVTNATFPPKDGPEDQSDKPEDGKDGGETG